MNKNEQTEVKVSVVVPVWNPGPWFSRCIESIRNQSLKEIEIIFVDDCGTDGSMDKVRAAASEDVRIRIILNERNMGPGYSRNRGIESAQGEYLSFVDSDDYLAPDFLELLYSEACKAQADIVKGRTVLARSDGMFDKGNAVVNQRIRDKLSKGEPLYSAFTRGHQNTIFRADFILSKNVRYGLSGRFEDVLFLLQACSQSVVFSTVDEACYYYCENENSLTHASGQMKPYVEGVRELVKYASRSLPKNEYTAGYLRDLFLSAVRELYRYEGSQGLEATQKWSEDLLAELSWSPYCHEIISDSFSLRVWHDYGYLLPREPFYYGWEGRNPPIRFAKLVERWVDFLLEVPGETDACWGDLIGLVKRASNAVNKKTHSRYSAEEKERGRVLLRQQIDRLPPNLKYRLKLSGTRWSRVAKAAATLSRRAKRVIRRVKRETATTAFGTSRKS